jgi:hypothetical protein
MVDQLDILRRFEAYYRGFILPIIFGALLDLTQISLERLTLTSGVVWVHLIQNPSRDHRLNVLNCDALQPRTWPDRNVRST